MFWTSRHLSEALTPPLSSVGIEHSRFLHLRFKQSYITLCPSLNAAALANRIFLLSASHPASKFICVEFHIMTRRAITPRAKEKL